MKIALTAVSLSIRWRYDQTAEHGPSQVTIDLDHLRWTPNVRQPEPCLKV
jgi:hypothetical protein